MATALLIVFLILYLAEYAFQTLLVILDLRKAAQEGAMALRPEIEAVLDRERYDKSKAYGLARDRLGLILSAVSVPTFLALLLWGGFEWLDTLARSLNLNDSHTGAVYLTGLSVATSILGIPARIYAIFVIEERFGFNKTTPGLFAKDTVKKLVLSAAMTYGLLLLVFTFLDLGGEFWWLWAAGGVLVVQIIMVFLYPLVILPMFNTFRLLEDEELGADITALADRVGFPLKDVRVMDGSRRTGHSNAFFIGLLGMRRIVLYDTLVEKSSREEILAVLAHEMGHWKLGHMLKRLLVIVPFSLAGFFALHLVLDWPAFFEAFGLSRPSAWTGLLFVMFFVGTLFYWVNPLFAWWSRKCEYGADRFALEHGPGAEPMKSSLVKLSVDNLDNFTPHPLRVAFHYSHPPLAERLGALDRAASTVASGEEAGTGS